MSNVLFFLLSFTIPFLAHASPKMIIISIDSLRPEFYLAKEFDTPTLKGLAKNGAFASSATSVFPSVTYPAHSTMMTGEMPDKHGIISNTVLDWEKGPLSTWLWESALIKVPTLWQKAKEANKTVAMIMWPVTVGEKINWIVPEIFPVTGLDKQTQWQLLEKHSTPGLMTELDSVIRKKLPVTPVNNYEWDAWETLAAEHIRQKYAPDLMLVHLCTMDDTQHERGREAHDLKDALKKVDMMVQKIIGPDLSNTCVVIVGDHGHSSLNKRVHVNSLLVKGGWIDLDEEGQIKSWKAIAHVDGGGAMLYVKEKSEIKKVISYLQNHSMNSFTLYGKNKVKELRGHKMAEGILEASSGFGFGTNLKGELITSESTTKGTHGYLPDRPEMKTGFIVAGCGIMPGIQLGNVHLRDVAPTAAKLMGLSMGSVEGKVLKIK